MAHPHPGRAEHYTSVQVVPNYFGVRVAGQERTPSLPVGAEYSGGRLTTAAGDPPIGEEHFAMPPSWASSAAIPAAPGAPA